MSSFNVSIPLRGNTDDGYQMIKNIKTMIYQNFKMLLLTTPGERVMIPEYGVGMRHFLFELDLPSTQQQIRSTINEQVGVYMPYVKIEEIEFISALHQAQVLQVSISYGVPSLNIRDLFTLEL